MATPTYTLIDSTTLSTAAASVTFGSIPAGGDLVLAIEHTMSGNVPFRVYLNSDTASNYNYVYMRGDGSSGSSNAASSTVAATGRGQTDKGTTIIHFFDYSVTDKQKSYLVRTDTASVATETRAQRWANTAAITSLEINGVTQTFNAGSTFHLFNIAKEL
jgi:hypothetical protein